MKAICPWCNRSVRAVDKDHESLIEGIVMLCRHPYFPRPACKGSGELGSFTKVRKCPACHGTGWELTSPPSAKASPDARSEQREEE